MRILIEINCDTIGQILTHLNEIKKEVSTEMKDQRLQMHKGRCEFPLDTLEEHITIRANQIKESKNYTLEREAEQWRNIKPQLDLFEKITGISINQYEDIAGIGEAVRQIRNGGLEKFLKRFERISEEVKSVHDRMLEGQAKIYDYLNSKK